MQDRKRNDSAEKLTLLELVLRVQGEFRRSLDPIRVTPFQAGVLFFLSRHTNATMTDAADSLGVRLPTLSIVVKDLVRKRWITRRHLVENRRAVCLPLTQRGEALAQKIAERVQHVKSDLTRQSGA